MGGLKICVEFMVHWMRVWYEVQNVAEGKNKNKTWLR